MLHMSEARADHRIPCILHTEDGSMSADSVVYNPRSVLELVPPRNGNNLAEQALC